MPYCKPCDRDFSSESALDAHLGAAAVHKRDYCSLCNRLFADWNALSSHRANSALHDWCTLCKVEFNHKDDLDAHMDTDHPTCCDKHFKNAVGLHEHRRQAEKHKGLYCAEHRKVFKTRANMQAHLNSKQHLPKKHHCAANACDKAFINPMAVLLHLTSGGCIAGVNLKLIDTFADTFNLEVPRSGIPARMESGGAGMAHGGVPIRSLRMGTLKMC